MWLNHGDVNGKRGVGRGKVPPTESPDKAIGNYRSGPHQVDFKQKTRVQTSLRNWRKVHPKDGTGTADHRHDHGEAVTRARRRSSFHGKEK